MEAVHKKRVQASYGSALSGKRIVVLGIRDKYAYMQPELVHYYECGSRLTCGAKRKVGT